MDNVPVSIFTGLKVIDFGGDFAAGNVLGLCQQIKDMVCLQEEVIGPFCQEHKSGIQARTIFYLTNT